MSYIILFSCYIVVYFFSDVNFSMRDFYAQPMLSSKRDSNLSMSQKALILPF